MHGVSLVRRASSQVGPQGHRGAPSIPYLQPLGTISRSAPGSRFGLTLPIWGLATLI